MWASGRCRTPHSCNSGLRYEVQESKESRLYSNLRALHQLASHYVALYNTMVFSNAVWLLTGKHLHSEITGWAERTIMGRGFSEWLELRFKQLMGCLLKMWVDKQPVPFDHKCNIPAKLSAFPESSQPCETLERFTLIWPQKGSQTSKPCYSEPPF